LSVSTIDRSQNDIRPADAFIEPVRRVLDWMISLRDSQGRIMCPWHRIEHTGKNAGVIVMASVLADLTDGSDRDELIAVAVQQAHRLCARLEREDDSTCFTFRPGRHDPYNCSNNVIDGGACSDALAELVLRHGDKLARQDRELFQAASVRHAQTYLRYAIIDKGVPAQRAWAMTGAAGAWKLVGHDVLELAVMEGAGILAGVQNPDGGYPYHPIEGGAGHPGASDVSAFYQSRVTAFLMFSLERMGRDPVSPLHRAPIMRGLTMLEALFGPDGIKVGTLEAKPWYWGASYEVAAHPFDVYALSRGAVLYNKEHFGRAALRAFEAWSQHLSPTGQPSSHHPAPGREASYQCPVFWAGHASWMARSLESLQRCSQLNTATCTATELAIMHFPNASLTRLEDECVVAWVRGKRPGYNVSHGSPFGAGLLRVYSKRRDEDLLVRSRFAQQIEGEWSAEAGASSLQRGWESCGKELRFSLWLARNELRRRAPLEAIKAPWHALSRGLLPYASAHLNSSFDLNPEAALLPDGVELQSQLAWRGGLPLKDSRLVRRFRVDGGGLIVEDRLASADDIRKLHYTLPKAATEVERDERRIRYRLV
jgi:hypothetical protein